MDQLHEKYENLKAYLKSLGSVAVAFSSGVDSTFLLKVAHDVLGDKAIAVTAASCSFPERELNEAKSSPLRAAELNKQEIRELSKELGLSTWNKQSFACLSSRFVYGETINEEKLGMVEKAEQLLLDLGFYQVRVRIHDKMARIEILPSEFEKLLAEGIREKVYNYFKELGFTYVTLDLGGYRTGSMNETLH